MPGRLRLYIVISWDFPVDVLQAKEVAIILDF